MTLDELDIQELTRITRRGRMTIPQAVRDAVGIVERTACLVGVGTVERDGETRRAIVVVPARVDVEEGSW